MTPRGWPGSVGPTTWPGCTSSGSRTPNGLGDAVSYAEAFVGDESFAVLLGDDIIDERDVLLKRMLDVQAETGGVVVGLIEVEGRFISLYGSIKPAGEVIDDVIAIETLIEKPKPEEALSNLAVIGRYVLPPSIFDALRRTELGQARRAGADRRHAHPGRGRRADPRRGVPGPPLRHGRSAGLSAGRRQAGVRASRAGSGLLGLAGRFRRASCRGRRPSQRGHRSQGEHDRHRRGARDREQRLSRPRSCRRSPARPARPRLRTVDEQLSRVLATIGSVDPIELTLLDAQGLLLAEQVLADAPLPGFDNAAMDGYAVRAVDLKEAIAGPAGGVAGRR